jgi:hypothetical protein
MSPADKVADGKVIAYHSVALRGIWAVPPSGPVWIAHVRLILVAFPRTPSTVNTLKRSSLC